MPSVEVILTENITGLGAEADQVKVKSGYARNFLVPFGKAYYVTAANLNRLNTLRAKRAEREAKELNDSQAFARKINKLKATITLETGETGKAFGSITTHDIAKKIVELLGGKVEVDHHKVDIKKPIKTTGEHQVPVKLHPDVTATFKLTVKSSSEEAAAAASEDA